MATGQWKKPANEGEAIVFALRHSLRRELLVKYAEARTSPSRLAARLGEDLHMVTYHSRCLEFYGMLDLEREEPVGGSTEHFFEISELGRRALFFAEQTGMMEDPDADVE